MKSETKYLDKTEACYETEYALRQDIHYRKGEILKLEHINAKHGREIERLRSMFVEKDKRIGELLYRIDSIKVNNYDDVVTLTNRINELEFELNTRNVPAMKESLKSSARLAIKQEEEIESLNARISAILETTPDVSGENLFEYVRTLIVETLQKDKNRRMYPKPNDIDMDYVKSALKYIIPGLFDPYTFLTERERSRIKTYISKDTASGDKIDRITELKDLFEYLKALLIELSRKEGNAPINPDDIDVKYIEAASRYCYPVLFDKYAVLDQDDTTKLKIQFAEYILRMFGLENMYEYENLHTRGEIELEFTDHRHQVC